MTSLIRRFACMAVLAGLFQTVSGDVRGQKRGAGASTSKAQKNPQAATPRAGAAVVQPTPSNAQPVAPAKPEAVFSTTKSLQPQLLRRLEALHAMSPNTQPEAQLIEMEIQQIQALLYGRSINEEDVDEVGGGATQRSSSNKPSANGRAAKGAAAAAGRAAAAAVLRSGIASRGGGRGNTSAPANPQRRGKR